MYNTTLIVSYNKSLKSHWYYYWCHQWHSLMRYVVNILYWTLVVWSSPICTWYHHRDIEVSVHHSKHCIVGHWQCTIVNWQARIHVLFSPPYILHKSDIDVVGFFIVGRVGREKVVTTKLSKYWLAIDKSKQTTIITLTVFTFFFSPFIHLSWLHHFNFAPCVIQTPPFWTLLVHPW